MDLRYRVLLNGSVATAYKSGRVVDISSTGVLFSAGQSCPQGTAVELSLDWPVLYDEAFHIGLSVIGSVVRSDVRGTAIRILRHGFEPWRDEPVSADATEAGSLCMQAASGPFPYQQLL
jgi:hypothetical protein